MNNWIGFNNLLYYNYRVHIIYNYTETYIPKVIQAMTFRLDIVSLKRCLIYFTSDFLSVRIELQQYGRHQRSVETSL